MSLSSKDSVHRVRGPGLGKVWGETAVEGEEDEREEYSSEHGGGVEHGTHTGRSET